MKPTSWALIGVAPLALLACGPKSGDASAANVTTTETTNVTVPADDNTASAGNTAGADAAIQTPVGSTDYVKMAAIGDMFEIASSKLAATNAKSPAVKKFAAEMVTAHTATTAGLKAAIAKGGVDATPPAALDAEHQALLDALTKAKGAEFDTLYVAQQKDAHAKALALHQGYASGGDNSALKAFAASTVPKVQNHVDMLKTL